MKKKTYLILQIFAMIAIACSCSNNQEIVEEKKEYSDVATSGAVDWVSESAYGTSVFGEDTDEWCPYVDSDKFYREELKKGNNYSLYISNYPEIHSRKDVKGKINIGEEELYYTILEIGKSEVTYYEDDAKKREKTIVYNTGYYRIYKRVGNRFYTLWIDQELDEESIRKKAKKIFDKYCTL